MLISRYYIEDWWVT